MELRVIYLKEFGEERFYPYSEDDSSAQILRLMKRKSFTKKQLQNCKEFGWDIIVMTNEYSFDNVKE